MAYIITLHDRTSRKSKEVSRPSTAHGLIIYQHLGKSDVIASTNAQSHTSVLDDGEPEIKPKSATHI